MPSNKNKAAAVPYINQKGERSMKKVKVEMYVAGKKPSYAPDDDDDDEDLSEEEEIDEEIDEVDDEQKYGVNADDEIFAEEDDDEGRRLVQRPNEELAQGTSTAWTSGAVINDVDEDHDDDPRLMKLKQLSSVKLTNEQLIKAQTASQRAYNFNENNAIIDDEKEEDIKMRHLTARNLKQAEPIGAQAVLSELARCTDPKYNYGEDEDDDAEEEKELETEDILGSFTVKLICGKDIKSRDKVEAEERVKKLLRNGQREAELKADSLRMIQEENKRELEKEALDKGDFELYEIEAINTDDEDDELAYEEWKLREIKRVHRDRLERVAKL